MAVTDDWNGLPPAEAIEPGVPGRIGRYQPRRVLGRGGMGVVYLADQLEPVERPVALKLIRSPASGEEFLRRFEMERQLLARMSHPSVASVYDAGVSDEGWPYLVMEYVPGRSITKGCDERKLSVRSRVELLIEVCRAVSHAHQRTVIHRDLKPSNILLTSAEGRLIPKVIDFGIARATDHEDSSTAGWTQPGVPFGTIGYMSPEQAWGRLAEVDTRTDVYSLGVVLYELLTGVMPVDPASIDHLDAIERRRAASAGDPAPPSSRLKALLTEVDAQATAPTLDATRTMPTGDPPARVVSLRDIATDRGVVAPALIRHIRGDLDCIVQKAMAAEPGRRYGSVRELMDDLQRYLSSQPIHARPPTVAYHAMKFVRRHRVLVSSAASIVAILCIATATSWSAMRQAIHAKGEADSASARAQNENAKRTLYQDTFSQLLSSRGSRDATIGELIDDMARRVAAGALNSRGDRKLDAEGRAWIQSFLGEQYRQLGDYPAARTQVEAAIERQRADPALAGDLADSLERLGRLEFEQRSNTARAVELLREADRLRGSESSAARTAIQLGEVCFEAGDLSQAMRAFAAADASLAAQAQPDVEAQITLVNDQAYVLAAIGEHELAEELYRRAVEFDRQGGKESEDYLSTSLNNLAVSLIFQGYVDLANPVMREAEEIRRRRSGAESLGAANCLLTRAYASFARGELKEAHVTVEQVIEIQRKAVGQDIHLAIAFSRIILAAIQRESGDAAGADASLRQSSDEYETLTGRVSWHVPLMYWHNPASLALARGDYQRAFEYYDRAVQAYDKVLGAGSIPAAVAQRGRGAALSSLGRHDEAMASLKASTEQLAATLGESHAATELTRIAWIAAASRTTGGAALAETEELAKIAQRPRASAEPTGPRIAALLQQAKWNPRARSLLEQALESCRLLLPDDDPRVRRITIELEDSRAD